MLRNANTNEIYHEFSYKDRNDPMVKTTIDMMTKLYKKNGKLGKSIIIKKWYKGNGVIITVEKVA